MHKVPPYLTKLLELFHKFHKKNLPFKWGEEQQATFQKVNDVLSSPLPMISPLILYLDSINKLIGVLLAQ